MEIFKEYKKAEIFKKKLEILLELQPEKTMTFDDKGFSEIYKRLYFSELRYNVTAKEWYYFDGVKWCEDVGGMHAARNAREMSDLLSIYVSRIHDDEKRQLFFKHAAKYGAAKNRETIVRDARCLMTIEQKDFDRNAHLLNLQNGTLNLDTFKFQFHDPNDFISKVCGCRYEENAVSELWEKFIDDIMLSDAEKIRYLQRLSGYWLTADIGLECGFFLYGATTRNGKGTFTGTFASMLGDYAGTLNPESLTLSKFKNGASASPDIAALYGKRFVNISEPEQRMSLDAALYKRLTGGDIINARKLYAEPFEFYPQFKLCFNCNHLPTVLDDTVFQSNRTRIITFDRHFEPQEQDRELKEKLKKTDVLAAVLQWAIVGLMDFKQHGECIPEYVSFESTAYRQKNDKMLRFFEDCLQPSTTPLKALDAFKRYGMWCKENNLYSEGKTAFFKCLRVKNLLVEKGTIDGKTVKNIIPNFSLR